ncbi:unnamed protein product [Aphanomyces euteiches]|nr:hypothetical protein AeRB84_008199 [Aphanomyces euteiches]
MGTTVIHRATNLSSVAVIATCALAWIHDQPNDSIAVEDVIYVAQADQINRVLRGNVKPIGPELSKQEKSGEKWGHWLGKAGGGRVGMAIGTATAGGELAGKKYAPKIGAKIGRFFGNREAKKGKQILKELTERNTELKAVSDKRSRISLNQPRPLMKRIIRSNSAASSVSYEKGQEPNPNANQPANQRQPNPASKTVSGDHDEHGDKEAQDEAEETTTGRRRARRGRRRRGLVSVEEAQDEADETMRELTATADLPKT